MMHLEANTQVACKDNIYWELHVSIPMDILVGKTVCSEQLIPIVFKIEYYKSPLRKKKNSWV